MKTTRLILILSIFIFLGLTNCSEKKNQNFNKESVILASLPRVEIDVPRIDTEIPPSNPGATATTTESSTGIQSEPISSTTNVSSSAGTTSTGSAQTTQESRPVEENRPTQETPVSVPTEPDSYLNRYIPQNFSLSIPVKPEKTPSNQVDLSKCYVDQSVEAGDIGSHNSRLCGVAFDQVKLELHALFLDLALSDIRALCRNKLPTCDLNGQKVDITISEPIMRTIEKLYDFYAYVGLQSYFMYNGYELKTGAKLPYELKIYEEIEHPIYEYRAVIKQRVISTQGTNVQERPGAADITIYWNKTRKNILFQFQTIVEVFGYKINARRVYDYSMEERKMNLTTELDYWTDTDYAFRLGQSASIKECEGVLKCVQFKGIGGFYAGDDTNKDGVRGSEIYCHALRSSSGVLDANGAIVTNSFPESGMLNELTVYKNQKDILFQLEPSSPQSGVWKISAFSPGQDMDILKENYYYKTFIAEDGRLKTDAITAKTTITPLMPTNPKTIFWQSLGSPELALPLNGYTLTGVQTAIKLKFQDISDDSYWSQFLPDGSRNYWKSDL